MVHQELLKTVIGKHGLLSLTHFTQLVAAVICTLEGGVDTIAFSSSTSPLVLRRCYPEQEEPGLHSG
ncbi:hypothetical protein N7532_007014 [Penicillium argentinense]|uniref:Uncharacterized protein n=1 Tax=Penicillium argentinense TaxID=1131581 RepID=A0A9W9FGX6_9EURO|nr:uncharacterized protein N7532_007014 [Penicillium argentinense]KAJ5100013.1 hypothetical protein N7532_007014 [Penicillium argentinense]